MRLSERIPPSLAVGLNGTVPDVLTHLQQELAEQILQRSA